MLSDTSFSIAGHTFWISNTSLLITAAVILGVVVLLLAFSRGKQQIVTIKRSVMTDELSLQLGRIADALERLEYQRSQQIIAETSQRVETPAPTTDAPPIVNEGARTVSYSMFGR